MTREEAIVNVTTAIRKTRSEHKGDGTDVWAIGFINQVEALGLIRFDDGITAQIERHHQRVRDRLSAEKYEFEATGAFPPNAEGGEQPTLPSGPHGDEPEGDPVWARGAKRARFEDALVKLVGTQGRYAIEDLLAEHGFTIARKP